MDKILQVKREKLAESSDKDKMLLQKEIEHIEFSINNYGKQVKYMDLATRAWPARPPGRSVLKILIARLIAG